MHKLTAILAGLLLILSANTAALASTNSPRGHSYASSNTAKNGPNCGAFRTYFEANEHGYNGRTTFTANPYGCTQQAALKCATRSGSTHWRYGAWQANLGWYSDVNCLYPYDTACLLNVNVSDNGGVTYYYYHDWYYNSPAQC